MKKPANQLAQIIKINYVKNENLVRLSLKTTISTDTHYGDVTINQTRNLLLIQAPSLTRYKIKEFLAQVIENQNSSGIIHENNLNLNQSLKLFELIAAKNQNNIIEILTIHFEPELGYKYGKEIYTELSYRFIENRCASKHQDFNELAKNGKRITMKLIISKCRNLVRDKRIKLIIKPDSSFRAYTDIEQEVWDDFCFNVGYVADD